MKWPKRSIRRHEYFIVGIVFGILFLIKLLTLVPVNTAEIRLDITTTDIQLRLAQDWDVGLLSSSTASLTEVCADSGAPENITFSSVSENMPGSLRLGQYLRAGSFVSIKTAPDALLITFETSDETDCQNAANIGATFIPPASGSHMVLSNGLSQRRVERPYRFEFTGIGTILLGETGTLRERPLRAAYVKDITFDISEPAYFSETMSRPVMPRMSAIETGAVSFARFPDHDFEISYGQPLELQLRNALIHDIRIVEDRILLSLIGNVSGLRTGFSFSGTPQTTHNAMPSWLDLILGNRLFGAFSAFILFLISVVTFLQSRKV